MAEPCSGMFGGDVTFPPHCVPETWYTHVDHSVMLKLPDPTEAIDWLFGACEILVCL